MSGHRNKRKFSSLIAKPDLFIPFREPSALTAGMCCRNRKYATVQVPRPTYDRRRDLARVSAEKSKPPQTS